YRELGAALRIPGSINIVCLGESTTAGLWIRFEDSYPKQLERVLREFYRTNAINVIVPPHIGQNTSQMANLPSSATPSSAPAPQPLRTHPGRISSGPRTTSAELRAAFQPVFS